MKKVLILEDEVSIRSFVVINLKRAGYEVIEAGTGGEALEKLKANPDVGVAILDIMLPDIDGFEVCRGIRATDKKIGIIMLTARSQEMDKITGLMTGADDYMTKPFGVMELISRVKAMLRRSAKPEERTKVLKFGNIVLDRDRHAVSVGDKPVELTYKEYELLKLLLTNAGIVTTRETILDRIWGTDFEGESRTLDMHMKTLRQKLGEAGAMIKTVRNVGYILKE